MDLAVALACSLPSAQHLVICQRELPIDYQDRNQLEVRQQTAPDGQVLPAWLTWSPVRIPNCIPDDSTKLPLMEK